MESLYIKICKSLIFIPHMYLIRFSYAKKKERGECVIQTYNPEMRQTKLRISFKKCNIEFHTYVLFPISIFLNSMHLKMFNMLSVYMFDNSIFVFSLQFMCMFVLEKWYFSSRTPTHQICTLKNIWISFLRFAKWIWKKCINIFCIFLYTRTLKQQNL